MLALHGTGAMPWAALRGGDSGHGHQESRPCDGVAMRSDGSAAHAGGGGGGGWRCMSCKQEMSDEAWRRDSRPAELSAKAEALRERPVPAASGEAGDKIALGKAMGRCRPCCRRCARSSRRRIRAAAAQALLGAPGLEPMMLASASAQALAWLECAAAGCAEGVRPCRRHAAHTECGLVGDAATAVLRVESALPQGARAIGAVVASRYLPWAVRHLAMKIAPSRRCARSSIRSARQRKRHGHKPAHEPVSVSE